MLMHLNPSPLPALKAALGEPSHLIRNNGYGHEDE